MRKFIIIVFVLICYRAFCALNVEEKNGEITVENEKIKCVFSPQRGGIVSSFYYKEWKSNKIKDLIPERKKYMGLFMDHLWGQTWPGELLEVPYSIVSLDKKSDYFSLVLERKVSGLWQGVQQDVIKDLILQKKYLIREDSEVVYCYIKLINNTEHSKLPAYWLQNVFFIGGDYDGEKDVFYRPSLRGIRKSLQRKGESDFLKDPYLGWSAAIDTDKGEGIVFLMDYNFLDMLYNCGGNSTLEFMYDKVPLPPSKSWETEIIMIPFSAIDSIGHASTHMVSGMEIKREKETLEIKHKLKAISTDLRNLELVTEILNPLEKKKIEMPPTKVDIVGKDGFREVVQKGKIEMSDPLVIFVRVRGEKLSEEYFDFYPGTYGYGDNVQQDMITPVFKMTRISKQQKLMKPEKIEKTYDGKLDVFFMKGLLAENYRIEEVMEKLKNKMEVNCEYGYYSIGLEGPRITYFPFDYNEIMKKDIIVLGNVNLECLGNLGIEILLDYVQAGGCIILLGGQTSFGAGGLTGSCLDKILPVEIKATPFDIELKKDSYLIFDKKFLGNLKIERKIYSPYMHRVKARAGANVLIKTNTGEPFLVYGEVEKGGKVFCITGAPFEYGKLGVFFNVSEWEEILEKVFSKIKKF